jgi:hypothetical protein
MKIKSIILLIFSILFLISCDKNDEFTSKSDLLIGSWINEQTKDTLKTYERADNLKDKDYGFIFRSDGIFVERKNAGWCGTPPISYEDFKGIWIKNDSIIDITVKYWGGLSDYKWKIIFLDKSRLTIAILFEGDHFENK